GDYTSGAMQGSNFTDDLRQAGLKSPNALIKVWDASTMIGGPIRRDRLWYLVGLNHGGIRRSVAGMVFNKNENDPTKWTYEQDLTRPAETDNTQMSASLRLTYQASRRNKFNFYNDSQSLKDNQLGGGQATVAPEAQLPDRVVPNQLMSMTWNSPWTNH